MLDGHAIDSDIFHRPYSVIGDKDIEAPKPLDGFGDERASGIRMVEITLNRGRTAFFRQRFRLRPRGAIAECNLRVRSREQPHRRSPNAARSAGD